MKLLHVSLAVLAVVISAAAILLTWVNRYSDPTADAPFLLTPVGLPILGVVALVFLSVTTYVLLLMMASGVEWAVEQVHHIATARGVRAKLIAVGGLLVGAVVAFWFLRYLLFGGCSAVEATTGC